MRFGDHGMAEAATPKRRLQVASVTSLYDLIRSIRGAPRREPATKPSARTDCANVTASNVAQYDWTMSTTVA